MVDLEKIKNMEPKDFIDNVYNGGYRTYYNNKIDSLLYVHGTLGYGEMYKKLTDSVGTPNLNHPLRLSTQGCNDVIMILQNFLIEINEVVNEDVNFKTRLKHLSEDISNLTLDVISSDKKVDSLKKFESIGRQLIKIKPYLSDNIYLTLLDKLKKIKNIYDSDNNRSNVKDIYDSLKPVSQIKSHHKYNLEYESMLPSKYSIDEILDETRNMMNNIDKR